MNKIPHTSLNVVFKILNWKVFQFHQNLIWLDWKFHEVFKEYFCQILVLQKGPENITFLTFLMEKGCSVVSFQIRGLLCKSSCQSPMETGRQLDAVRCRFDVPQRADDLQRQIGRASCRERVCLYV